MSNMEKNISFSTYNDNIISDTDIPRDSPILIVFVISCSTVYIIFNIVVVIALRKTKCIPSMAKFLAILLLLHYVIIAIIIICRRVVGFNRNALVILTVLGSAFRLINYVIIAMLAFDRAVVIQYPFLYCRNMPSFKVKSVAIVIWCIVFSWFVFGMIWKCNLTDSQDELMKMTCFKHATPPFAGPVMGATFILVCGCFLIISRTLYKQTVGRKITVCTGIYKTTIAIVANIINYLVIFVIYIISVLLLDSPQNVLFIFEVLTGLNALLDTVIYALWFKECRMELLKMASLCIPDLGQEVERLRYQVFNISVT